MISIDVTSGIVRIPYIDAEDGTPILDIKPYLPYVDAVPAARGGYAPEVPEAVLQVKFTPRAEMQCDRYATSYPKLRSLIVHLLELDPRPAYHARTQTRTEFGMRLLEFDVKWRMQDEQVIVLAVEAEQA